MSSPGQDQQQQQEGAPKLPPAQSAFVVDSDDLAKKRTSYYDKWRTKSKEAVDQIKEEEEAEKALADTTLGRSESAPKSEAERKDQEKRAALREAKKQWEGKKALDEAQIFTLSNVAENSTLSVTKAEILHRPVLRINSCKACTLVLEEDMGALIKIFVDDCDKVKLVVKCSTITQHIEVSRSSDLELVLALPLHTLQLDLVEGITIRYEANCLREGDRLYHAGVKGLSVHHSDGQHVSHDYTDSQLHQGDAATQNMPEEEKQYVTHLKNGVLLTERVRRASGMMPLTDEELAKVAGDTEIETAHIRQAKEKRTAGNEAFANGEYMQSGVFYTQAMGLVPGDQELLSICLSNRAACNLKLGRLEEALEDATACTVMRPEYTKGWFRRGIALHALKQYGPAIESLAKADQMDPKNKQIKEALGFAQVMLRKEQKERADKFKS